MSMNETPSSERVHIGFFGRRNAGKSSLVNAITNQDLAVVSAKKGTTTDPVTKTMELLPIGPVVIIDTPGFDDEGELGELRVRKTRQVLNRTDLAVLVTDAAEELTPCDRELIGLFKEKEIPYLIARNKCDLLPEEAVQEENKSDTEIYVSATKNIHIYELKEKIAKVSKSTINDKALVRDLVKEGSLVVLVIPIDSAAPKGRIILPQQQVIRDLLEGHCASICVSEKELAGLLKKLEPLKPDLVITDSQAFAEVSAVTPRDIPLTSFSILLARYKGFLDTALKGVEKIKELKDGDKVLISEGCTHHRQCDDIGTVKIPRWLKNHTQKELIIETSSGKGFPEDLSPYAMVIHCGGCMLNEREMLYRMKCACDQGIPFTNYGITIASMKGILERSTEIIRNAE